MNGAAREAGASSPGKEGLLLHALLHRASGIYTNGWKLSLGKLIV